MPDSNFTPEDVAASLTAGVAALRAGDAAAAIPLLSLALDALETEPDLDDFSARAASLLAQAQLDDGHPVAARTAAHRALRILRRHGDQAGLDEVRALDEQIGAALQAQQRQRKARAQAAQGCNTTTAAIEEQAKSPLARADALLKHATHLRLLERTADASHAAERARHWADHTDCVRESVMARIALAELGVDPSAHLLAAYSMAVAAHEPTLVGLIARTASLCSVVLPTETIAARPTERSP